MRPSPCIPFDPEGRLCLASLLLGTACCPDGTCGLCLQERARLQRVGFTRERIARDIARQRARLLPRCPSCGFPPPPHLGRIPPLPRLDRSDRTFGDSWTCRMCARPLPPGKRVFCSGGCYAESERRRAR